LQVTKHITVVVNVFFANLLLHKVAVPGGAQSISLHFLVYGSGVWPLCICGVRGRRSVLDRRTE